MTNEITTITTTTDTSLAHRQATSDEQFIGLWLHGRSRHTQRAYSKDAHEFVAFVNKPLHAVTLGDVQAFANHLADQPLCEGSRHRKLSSVKSLFGFGHRLGYLAYDVARPLRLPAMRETLNERILDESEVHRIIALEPHPRNRVLLHLLYASGVRVSEASGLRWRDCQQRCDGGQVTVLGKGSKTRTILLPTSAWSSLQTIRGCADEDRHVFMSRKGGPLGQPQIWVIVTAATRRAGVEKHVSPHWFRHAHASHALDRGAPIHLVQSTLGHSSVATTGRYLHARPTDSSSTFLLL